MMCVSGYSMATLFTAIMVVFIRCEIVADSVTVKHGVKLSTASGEFSSNPETITSEPPYSSNSSTVITLTHQPESHTTPGLQNLPGVFKTNIFQSDGGFKDRFPVGGTSEPLNSVTAETQSQTDPNRNKLFSEVKEPDYDSFDKVFRETENMLLENFYYLISIDQFVCGTLIMTSFRSLTFSLVLKGYATSRVKDHHINCSLGLLKLPHSPSVQVFYQQRHTDKAVGTVCFLVGNSSRCMNSTYEHFQVAADEVVPVVLIKDSTKTLSVKVLLKRELPPLEKKEMPEHYGVIQPPGFESRTAYGPVDDWVNISPAEGEATFVSVSSLDLKSMCSQERLELREGRSLTSVHLLLICGQQPLPSPAFYHSPTVYVHFVTTGYAQAQGGYQGQGFRLLFSHHKVSSLPQKGFDGQWNCSVPERSKFVAHFACNLIKECVGGDDEKNCPFSGNCKDGWFTSAGKCYEYVVPDQRITWESAKYACKQRGAHLVSLETPEEWSAMMDVLAHRPFLHCVYFGLHVKLPKKSHKLYDLYEHTQMWESGRRAYYSRVVRLRGSDCSKLGTDISRFERQLLEFGISCLQAYKCHYICEMGDVIPPEWRMYKMGQKIEMPTTSNATLKLPSVKCPKGQITFLFLACDVRADCWRDSLNREESFYQYGNWNFQPSHSVCPAPVTSLPPSFPCTNAEESVPFSLVCDHRIDCSDGSDESFCVFPPCLGQKANKCGNEQQCYSEAEHCDHQRQCENGADEEVCTRYVSFKEDIPPDPPAIVYHLRHEFFVKTTVKPLNFTSSFPGCPVTHFKCPGGGYCLPVYLRCNGFRDCPGDEDEAGCFSLLCPGLYRCRDAKACLHPSHVCDGLFQCPQGDDERFCHFTCPPDCVCHGLAFFCPHTFPVHQFPDVRYLDGSGSGLSFPEVNRSLLLIHLSLAVCNVTRFARLYLPNLRSLDLSANHIVSVPLELLLHLDRLQTLRLMANPLSATFMTENPNTLTVDVIPLGQSTPTSLGYSQPSVISRSPTYKAFHHFGIHGNRDSILNVPNLTVLDLSRTPLSKFDVTTLGVFPQLVYLNLSQAGVDRLRRARFGNLTQLRVLDLRGCPLADIPPRLFSGLDALDAVHADDYRLCCSEHLPNHTVSCNTPDDLFSSCSRLLGLDSYRVVICMCAVLLPVLNLVSLALRGHLSCSRSKGTTSTETTTPWGDTLASRSVPGKTSVSALLTHLAISDCLRGLQLGVVCVADHVYKGDFLRHDRAWRNSFACQVSGFLALLSAKTSTLFVFLLTLHTVLILHWPARRLDFSPALFRVVCAVVWCGGALVALAPLSPGLSDWGVYTHTTLCVSLPFSTRKTGLGWDFCFGVTIVFDAALFVFVLIGQLVIGYSLPKVNFLRDVDHSKGRDPTANGTLVSASTSARPEAQDPTSARAHSSAIRMSDQTTKAATIPRNSGADMARSSNPDRATENVANVAGKEVISPGSVLCTRLGSHSGKDTVDRARPLSSPTEELVCAGRTETLCVFQLLLWLPAAFMAVLQTYDGPLSDRAFALMAVFGTPLGSLLTPLLYAFATRQQRLRRRHEQQIIQHLLARRLARKRPK